MFHNGSGSPGLVYFSALSVIASCAILPNSNAWAASRQRQSLPLAKKSDAKSTSPEALNKKQSKALQPPRLIVILTVDQMRSDLLDRFAPAMKKMAGGKEEGLLALRQHGVSFSQASTTSAPTVTAAGHATICSGVRAAQHGVVANEYYDRSLKRTVGATFDASAAVVTTPGIIPADPLSKAPSEGVSGRQMRTPGFADVLSELSHGMSRAVSVSIKDRGALFCAGQKPTGAYWYDAKSGSMVASNANAPALPGWVNAFNTNKRPDLNFTWAPVFPIETMQSLLADDKYRRGLLLRSPQSKMLGAAGFPYQLKASEAAGVTARNQFQLTPAASDYLVDFALASQAEERLGCASRKANEPCVAPSVPDLLAVSFSTPDLVGHAFGPESAELMDTYLRLNASVERLKNKLEEQLGAGQVLFVQSADHGVQPLVEFSQANGLSGGRGTFKEIKTVIENTLKEQFGEGPWVDEIVTNEIYLNQATLSARRKSPQEVLDVVRHKVSGLPGVRGLLTREEILKASTAEAALFKRGHDPERSGDAVLLLQQGWIADPKHAANHGSAFPDDTRIPIVFSGWKVARGVESKNPTSAEDIAPTLVEMLGGKVPSFMTGQSRAGEVLGKGVGEVSSSKKK